MVHVRRLVSSVALVALLLSGCGESKGASECSCAAGTTYGGTFYQQYANTSVRADVPIGKSDRASGCCGEAQPEVTIYSIEGIDSRIAIATKSADGTIYFNVASSLSERKQRVADRFAREHHHVQR